MPFSPEQATPIWLNTLLREAGVLSSGAVLVIERIGTGAFNSATNRLQITYSTDAPGNAPRSLILKCSNGTDWGNQAMRDEVNFYGLTASLPNYPAIMPLCYSAVYDESSQSAYLLLLDLTTTHRVPVTRDQQIAIDLGENVPAEFDIERAIETLANLHAYWWEHQLLGSAHLPYNYTDNSFSGYWQRRRQAVEWLLNTERSTLSPRLQKLCAETAAHFDRWWDHLAQRMRDKRHITLIHGDAYFANMLSPREGVSSQTYLIDWQSMEPHIGPFDLVNLCAMFWTRA